MRISTNIKNSFEEQYDIPELKLSDEIIDFFKSGGNLKIKCKKGSGIHIKKKNRGKFTASAEKAGQSVQEHARSVLNDPNATPLQKKRANFARNSKKWHHKNGGSMRIPGVIDSNPNLDNMKGDYVTPKKKKKKLLKKHQNGDIISKSKKYKAKYSGKVYNTREEAIEDNASYLKAKKLSEQTKNTPITYIGGNRDEARAGFWKQEPVLAHAIDSIANEYKINPDLLKYRINNEGFVDRMIQSRNNSGEYAQNTKEVFGDRRGYDLLNFKHDNHAVGPFLFGFDDMGTYIQNGNVKLINENYETGDFINEKGRQTNAATGLTINDNFGITAAGLKMFRDKAKKDFPNASEYDLDRYAAAYFNRGETGGRKWVRNGANGYNLK